MPVEADGINEKKEIVMKENQRLAQWLEKNYCGNTRHSGLTFKIDDESRGDVAGACCQIEAQFSDQTSDCFILELNRVPKDCDLEDLVEELAGTWSVNIHGTSDLKLNFTSRDYGTINRLALAIRRVVGRGKHYADSNWKWVAPRTAKSLNRFAQVLRTYRSSLQK